MERSRHFQILAKAALLASAVAVISSFAACTAKPKPPEVRVLSWSEYFKDDMVAAFEKKSGIKVTRDYFANNEELLAKVKASVAAGGKGYDLILPSDYMVQSMVKLKLLKTIDHKSFPVLATFAPEFLAPIYDTALEHCIPFAYGTTGVAVNTKLALKLDLSKGLSWKDLLETKDFAGKVTLLDDSKEALHAALLALGKSWKGVTEADVKSAFAYLKAHKGNLRIFTSETRPVIEAGECVLCQAYSGDVLAAADTKPEIRYVLPREGATVWTDNFAFPINGANTEGAQTFAAYMLSPEAAKAFTTATHYPTPNQEVRKALPDTVSKNPAIYPPAEQFKKLAFLTEREDLLPLIDRLWTELRSQ